jgi:hypothetical protein
MNHIIVDLDNCIADDAWRIPRINWQKANPMERYHDYHSLSGFDDLRNEDILMSAACDVAILVFTARPLQYRPMTEEWLRRKGVPFKHLIMRNNNDHRPSLELKRHMLHWLPEVYGVRWGSIVAAYDDRPDVVEMYLKHGIPSEVRAVHNVCAYTAPDTVTVSAA